MGLVTDMAVAGCMLWIVRATLRCLPEDTPSHAVFFLQLYTAKAHTMWRESANMITRLIAITVGSGAAVAICGLITLVTFVTAAETSYKYQAS